MRLADVATAPLATVTSHADPAAVGAVLQGVPVPVAQTGPEAATGTGFDPVSSFVLSLGLYLVVGTVLLSAAPRASRRAVERIHDEPLYALLLGLAGQVGAVVLTVLLAITVVGLVVAIPGLILWALLGVAGSTLAAVAVGALATDLAGIDSRAADLLTGAVVLSALTLVPVVANVVNVVAGSIGLGTLLGMWLDSRSGDRGGGRERPHDRVPHSR